MKTERENEIIKRILPYLAAAFNGTDKKLNCKMLYDNTSEAVLVEYYNGNHIEVSVYGDSPVAVILDVVKQLHRKMI